MEAGSVCLDTPAVEPFQVLLGEKEGSVASGFTIPRAVHDGEYHNLVGLLVHPIDDDIRRFNEFARSFDQAWPPDVREARNGKPVDSNENAAD